jgi:hypothetical protein
MAKGVKTGGRDFTKGHKFGKGGAGHNPALKAIRKLTNDEIAQLGTLILEGNLAALQDIKNDTNASVLKVWFASVAVKAISRGDAAALNAILDRIVGRSKETVELTGKNGNPIEVVHKTKAEREAEIARLLEKRRLVHEQD